MRVAVPLFRSFITPLRNSKLRRDGMSRAGDPAPNRLRVTQRHNGRFFISVPLTPRSIRAHVGPFRRYRCFLNVNMRSIAFALFRGAFFPHAWAKASSKGSNPCGTCPSLVPSLRTRILRFPGAGLGERRPGKWITGILGFNETCKKGDKRY